MLREWLEKEAGVAGALAGGALGGYLAANPRSVSDKNYTEQLLVDTRRMRPEIAQTRKKERTRNALIRSAVGAGVGALGGHYIPTKLKSEAARQVGELGREAGRSATREAIREINRSSFNPAIDRAVNRAVQQAGKGVKEQINDPAMREAAKGMAEQVGAGAAKGAVDEIPRRARSVKDRILGMFRRTPSP